MNADYRRHCVNPGDQDNQELTPQLIPLTQ